MSHWLSCKKKVFLAGIIYLHRISDNRMSGTPLRNLQMFGKLCGDGAIQNVVLASTMWDKVLPQTGNQRETELKNKYWAEMLKLGSQTLRFVLTFDSAWDIIEAAVKGKAVDKEHNLVLLQEELVGLKRKLGETQAGRALYPALEKLLAEQRGTLRKLEEQVETEENRQLAEELKAQYEETEETITILIGQLEELKVPLGRRLLLFLNRPRNVRESFIVFRFRSLNCPAARLDYQGIAYLSVSRNVLCRIF